MTAFEAFAAVCLFLMVISLASIAYDLDTIVKMYKGEDEGD